MSTTVDFNFDNFPQLLGSKKNNEILQIPEDSDDENNSYNKIQNATSDITNQITDKITQSGGVFDSVVNRQANFIDKITNQVNILL